LQVIRINQVTKVFGDGKRRVQAVDGLELVVEPGQVFGFLGPNGAGKSTTIRMMLDLIRPTAGSVELFGNDVRRDPAGLRKTGALVEGAMFYPFLTGRDNLRVLARTRGEDAGQKIDDLARKVDLSGRIDRKVSEYSTGMKQRLGIAAALLSDPELVILDEPTNGLDPGGIIEMRRFIRSLAELQGKTVFLSSHLLNEVEQIGDRVAIINKGRLVQEGRVSELLSGAVTELQLEVDPLERTVALLQERWEVARLEKPGWAGVHIDPDASPEIVKMLVEAGVAVRQAVVARQTLEDFFLSVTDQEGGRD
jgi:ABC-2 type transport system ATP-binding protein